MNWLEIAKTLVQLLPLIIQVIDELEAAFPAQGQGAVKLEALRGILQSAYNTGAAVSTAFDTLWPSIQGTVAAIVAARKAAPAVVQAIAK